MIRKLAPFLVLILVVTGCASGPTLRPIPMASAESAGDLIVPWSGLENGNGPGRTITGVYSCKAYGTWGGATLTMQIRREDGVWEAITGPAGLVGATVDTDYLELLAGQGTFRPTVSGGTGESLNVDCRRVIY